MLIMDIPDEIKRKRRKEIQFCLIQNAFSNLDQNHCEDKLVLLASMTKNNLIIIKQ